MDYFKTGSKFGVNIKYVEQTKPGIHGAVLSVEKELKELGEDTFLLMFGDIISRDELVQRTLNAFETTGEMTAAVTLKGKLEDWGIASLNANGQIENISTMEETIESDYILAGCFVLSTEVFKYLGKNNRFDLSLKNMINDGHVINGAIWEMEWQDVGTPWDLLNANKIVLSRISKSSISPDVEISKINIMGPVIIEDGVRIENGVTLKGPLYIGKNAYVGNNSLIREYTSIGDNCVVGFGVETKNAIISDNSKVNRLAYIGDSIIGENVYINAGVITVNVKIPKQEIHVRMGDKKVSTGLIKFGAIIGHNAKIGANVTLHPGIKVGANSVIHPGINIFEDVPDNIEVLPDGSRNPVR